MSHLDPNDPDVWRIVKSTVRSAQSSSFHCAIASVRPDGSAHVTPIGSVILTEPGRGLYLDVYNAELGRNLEIDPRLTVMAVDSGVRTWLTALVRGKFSSPPGVRLVGTAGAKRPLTDKERDRFLRTVRLAVRTKGGSKLWGSDGRYHARDLTFTEVDPVRLPRMTTHLWPAGVTSGLTE